MSYTVTFKILQQAGQSGLGGVIHHHPFDLCSNFRCDLIHELQALQVLLELQAGTQQRVITLSP